MGRHAPRCGRGLTCGLLPIAVRPPSLRTRPVPLSLSLVCVLSRFVSLVGSYTGYLRNKAMGNFTTKEAGPSKGPEGLMKCATAEDMVAVANKLGLSTTRGVDIELSIACGR